MTRGFTVWLLFFVVLQWLDVQTTYAAISRGVGAEANPFMVAVVEYPLLLLAVKGFMLVFTVAAWLWLSERGLASWFWFAAAPLTVGYVVIVANNLTILWW